MPQQTKIFRVFISSTFNDMKLERNLLREKVFPELEQLCRSNGARFQAIDLRWGVSEESQRNQKTMEICLNEIRRCQELSPKPNFLIMLGDRYGWQPVPAKIPETEMKALNAHLSKEDKKRVNEWFRLDTNAIPAEYVLQPWGDRIAEYQDWEPIEKQLRDVLRNAALKAVLDTDALIKYTASATHQEIIQGALNPPDDVKNPEEHVFALSRTIKNLPTDECAEGFIDFDNGKPDAYSHTQLELLKKQLKTKLNNNFIEYNVNWQDGSIRFDEKNDFTETDFVERTLSHQKRVIQEQLKDIVDEDELQMEIRYHKEFAESLTPHFTGRQTVLDEIQNYIDDGQNQKVLSLIGASGSGKTSVMAKAIEQVESNNAVLVYRFIGANAKSSNLLSLLSSVCAQIATAYDTTLENLAEEFQKEKLHEYNTLVDLFRKCLALATENKPVILFLDALDQLSETDNALDLNWLPKELATHSRVIVSCLPELVNKLQDTEIYHLPVMPHREAETLLDNWLSVHRRQLTPEQKHEVLQKFRQTPLPLYLKLAFEQARQWHSYSPQQDIFDTVPVIIEKFFAVLEKEHSPMLVAKAVGYMLSGKDKGLTEDEILDMLVFDKEYWDYFLAHSHPTHKAEVEKAGKLPVVVWSRLFLDLAPYLTERDSFGERLIGFYHRQFNEVLMQKYLSDGKNVHQKLADFFEDRWQEPYPRALSELPFHLIQIQEIPKLVTILTNIKFLQYKCAEKMTFELMKELEITNRHLSDSSIQSAREQADPSIIESYVQGLVRYSAGETNILEMPPTINLNNCRTNITPQVSNSFQNQKIEMIRSLVKDQCHTLSSYAKHHPTYLFMQVLNYANTYSLDDLFQQDFINSDSALIIKRKRKQIEINPGLMFCLEGHQSSISSVKISYDSSNVISSSKDKTIRSWCLNDGKLEFILESPEAINAMDTTPLNDYAITCSDEFVIYWDIKQRIILKKQKIDGEKFNQVFLRPDKKYALISSERKLYLWDLKCNNFHSWLMEKQETNFSMFFKVTPDISFHSLLLYSNLSDGNKLYKCSIEGKELINMQVVGETDHPIGCVAVTPDRKLAISGEDLQDWRHMFGEGPKAQVCLWNMKKEICKVSYHEHLDDIRCIDITPNGKIAVSAGIEGLIYIWDLSKNKLNSTIDDKKSVITNIDISPTGQLVAASNGNGNLKIWDLNSITSNIDIDPHDEKHTDAVINIEIDIKAQYGFSTSLNAGTLGAVGDKRLLIWDLSSGNVLYECHPDNWVSFLLPMHKSNDILFSGYSGSLYQKKFPDMDNEIHFDVPKGSWVIELLRNDEQAIIELGGDGVSLFSLKENRIVYYFPDDINGFSNIIDDRYIALNCSDAKIKIWDIWEKKYLCEIHSPGSIFKFIDMNNIICKDQNNTFSLINPQNGNVKNMFKLHQKEFEGMGLLDSNNYLVTVSDDIRIWDFETGSCLCCHYLGKHPSAVSKIQKNTVLLGFGDGSVEIYDLYEPLVKSDLRQNISNSLLDIHSSKDLNNELVRKRITDIKKKIISECNLCNHRFKVENRLINIIKDIYLNAGITEAQTQNNSLTDDSWDETNLSLNCPNCGRSIRLNSFIIDSKERFKLRSNKNNLQELKNIYSIYHEICMLRLLQVLEQIKVIKSVKTEPINKKIYKVNNRDKDELQNITKINKQQFESQYNQSSKRKRKINFSQVQEIKQNLSTFNNQTKNRQKSEFKIGKELAEAHFEKGNWSIAEDSFSLLLSDGAKIEEVGPKIIHCILHKNTQLSKFDEKRIIEIIKKLEVKGHYTIAKTMQVMVNNADKKPSSNKKNIERESPRHFNEKFAKLSTLHELFISSIKQKKNIDKIYCNRCGKNFPISLKMVYESNKEFYHHIKRIPYRLIGIILSVTLLKYSNKFIFFALIFGIPSVIKISFFIRNILMYIFKKSISIRCSSCRKLVFVKINNSSIVNLVKYSKARKKTTIKNKIKRIN